MVFTRYQIANYRLQHTDTLVFTFMDTYSKYPADLVVYTSWYIVVRNRYKGGETFSAFSTVYGPILRGKVAIQWSPKFRGARETGLTLSWKETA